MSDIDSIIKLADSYYNNCQQMVKISRIRKLPDGKFRVVSKDGKNLGTYKSREAAKKRLKQVEYFKHFDHAEADDSVIDLTEAEEFAYSAVMRKLREKASQEQVLLFLKLFKMQFDNAVKKKLQKPERVALQNALVKFNKVHKIKLDKKLLKNASVSELGNAEQVGKYLSDIVKFTIAKMQQDKRLNAVQRLRQKFLLMNENEISQKNLPESAAVGQSITFVKHVLFNHDSKYVRDVLNALVRNL